MSTKHYVKNITGAKFYREDYNSLYINGYGDYRLLAKPGEYYYLFLDIPFIIFPLKVIPYKRVLARENVWVYRDVVLPSKKEVHPADYFSKNYSYLKIVGDRVVVKCFVEITFSDGSIERKYFETDEDGLRYTDDLKKNNGLSTIEELID